MESIASTKSKAQWKQMGNEEKKAVVHEEMKRMNQLPANSTYVTHRLRVLNKILQLMTIQDCLTGRGIGVAFCWDAFVSWLGYAIAG